MYAVLKPNNTVSKIFKVSLMFPQRFYKPFFVSPRIFVHVILRTKNEGLEQRRYNGLLPVCLRTERSYRRRTPAPFHCYRPHSVLDSSLHLVDTPEPKRGKEE